MNDLNHIIDTTVSFDNIEDYYWHVFLSLYKNNILQSARHTYYQSYDNGYSFSFDLKSEPTIRLNWFLQDTSFNRKMFLFINNPYNSANNTLMKEKPINKFFSGYKFYNDDFNKKIDDTLKELLSYSNHFLHMNTHLQSNHFPIEFIQTLTIYSFYQQENFAKIFTKEIYINRIHEYQGELFISKLEHLISLFEVKENPFLDNLFKHKIIKKLLIDTTNIKPDNRSEKMLSLVNQLPEVYQDSFYNIILKKTTEKEKLCLKKLMDSSHFSPKYLKLYNDSLKEISIDKSIGSLSDPKQLLDNTNTSVDEKLTFEHNLSLPMEAVYAFYKKIYLKKNFPLNKEPLNIKLNLSNFHLLVSFEIKETKTLNIKFINKFKYIYQKEAGEFNDLLTKNLVYFFDMLIIKSHQSLLDGDNTFLSSKNPELMVNLNNFINEIREKELLKKLSKTENDQINSIKKKI